MISKNYLRYLVEAVILEGFKDDQRYLIEKHPEHAERLEGLGPKWIAWLTSRFGENPKVEEVHPFDDAIITVMNFSRRDAAIGEKYKASQQFREDIDSQFPPETRGWSSPADPTRMTVDEMETILGLAEKKKQTVKVDDAEDIEGDRVGKVGPWNLWMPTTREKSCKIAEYDPVTRRPKTTWCTARTSGSNLFYNYIGSPGTDVVLFYVIKDEARSRNDRLSIGFINGRPDLSGRDGGLSVNANNEGLKPESLRSILGPDHDEIMMMLTRKNKSLGGRHPARERVMRAARSVREFDDLIRGNSQDEASWLMDKILAEPAIDEKVVERMITKGNKFIRTRIVTDSKVKLSDELLDMIASDPDPGIRDKINLRFHPQIESMPSWLALKLWNDPVPAVRLSVMKHPAVPKDEYELLAQDLIRSKNKEDRISGARLSTDAGALAKLARDRATDVRRKVADNPNTPSETLVDLTRDKDHFVYQNAISNRNLPLEVLVSFSDDPDVNKRRDVAWNTRTPPEILVKLARDGEAQIRRHVASNPSTPIEIVRSLLRDSDFRVTQLAGEALEKREKTMSESRLRQLIRQML